MRIITGTLIFGGSVTMTRRGQTNALAKKSFLVKSYDEDGVFQGVLDDVISEFTFTQEINTSSSSIEILLARNSDFRGQVVSPILDSDDDEILDSNSRTILGNAQSLPKVGPGSDINYNNRIDVMAYYGSVEPILDSDGLEILDSNNETIDSIIGAPNGRRKFTGYISQINTQYGNEENTSITVTSYGADLKNYLVNDGAGSTTVPFNSYDPGNIIKESLDQFKLDAAAEDELVYTDYTDSTVLLTGSVASYTFKANNNQDMADKTLELAPAEWYYYIDLGTNLYHFQERSETPEHVFYLGKHIESLSLRSGIENSASQFLGVGGGDPALYKYYNRTRAPYTRRGLIQYSDSRVTLESSLDIISDYELDAKNRVQYKTAINILDRSVDGEKGYPIDTVTIGDTVGFRNFGNYVDELVFQIVGLTYEADRINLQLDTLSPTVSKRLADLRRNLDQQSSQYVPDDPLV